ncbi:MAG: hypothetical protein U0637_04760 [Phycisphaerales bacterium]
MISRVALLSCAGVAALGASEARAVYVTAPLGALANANLRTYTSGTNYPAGPTTLTIAGVPFDVTPLPGTPGSFGVAQSSSAQLQFTVPASVYGASRVYTLMNSAWGQLNALNGRIECTGSAGAFASFDIVQGVNLRDHWTAFNQTLTDPTVVMTDFGGGTHLDRQTFVLPPAFLTQTLTQVRLVANNPGNPQGAVFLAGATVEVAGPTCDTVDFNGDGLFPDTADIDDFLAVFSGGACSNDPHCGDVDFNNDGLFPDAFDIEVFLTVFSGGACQ